MAWRIVGGLCGWLLSLAPLALVNALAFSTTLDPSVIPLAGSVALLGGIALGGLAAGLLGGRRGAGVAGAILAGAIAAMLYVAALIALMYTLRAQSQLPYLLALHPIRTMAAIGFLGFLLLSVAAGVGALKGRRSATSVRSPERAPALSRPPRVAPHAGLREDQREAQRELWEATRPVQPSQPAARDPRYDQRRAAPSRAREQSPRW